MAVIELTVVVQNITTGKHFQFTSQFSFPVPFLKKGTFILSTTSLTEYIYIDLSAAGANSACACCFQSSSSALH